MSIGLFRGTLAGLTWATAFAAQAVAADPVALRAYNAAIDESSISGISSGGFMAVQFGTAWSSVIKGVGAIASGPYWCAKADANDFITWYWGPIFRATGSCMKGPPANLKLNDFTAKANAKAASGDIDPIQNLSRQKIYVFHGYNDKLVARAATDATTEFYRHFLGAPNRGNLYYQTTVGAGHSLVVLPKPGSNDLNRRLSDAPISGRCLTPRAYAQTVRAPLDVVREPGERTKETRRRQCSSRDPPSSRRRAFIYAKETPTRFSFRETIEPG